jgi:hypothetical protein
LTINYPYDVFDIENVTLNTSGSNLVYEVKDGRIRLSWFNLQPIELAANEALLTIHGKVHADLTAAYGWTPTITIGNESELARADGQVIEEINLSVPTITLPNQTILRKTETFKQFAYPNPATTRTNLEYNLPTDARVTIELYDALGRQVRVLTDEAQSTGVYQLEIDTQSLTQGLYTIKTIMKTTNGREVYTEQLMIMQ